MSIENVDVRILQEQYEKLRKQGGPSEPPGGEALEARVAKLETHVEYIRRDLDEVRSDVKAIKTRLAYFAGAAFVVSAIFAWVVNNRFDQVIGLLKP